MWTEDPVWMAAVAAKFPTVGHLTRDMSGEEKEDLCDRSFSKGYCQPP